ncbi:hypothetical protein CERZMDRAFT_6132, partial [Cercospora zeae-maydis SCOH1-5]
LRSHMRIHQPKDHFCHHPGCTYETTSNKDLERHAVIHSPEPKFSCQFCGQPGKRKDNMRRH